MHALIASLALLLASSIGGQQPPPPSVASFGGQQPPPPVTDQLPPPPQLRWECDCSAWAVVWEWHDGTRYAATGDLSPRGIATMLDALSDPTLSSITECFEACHTACNLGMPDGSPNAMCSATWIGATQTCRCVCRNLDGDCPPMQTIGTMGREGTDLHAQTWLLDIAWHKDHVGR